LPKQVTVITANPTGKGDLGACEVGHYVVENDLITMTDSDGAPLRDANTGERISHRMATNENEKTVAKRLTLKLFRSERGDDMAGFSRPLRYPKLAY
jgi:hypothetical protein